MTSSNQVRRFYVVMARLLTYHIFFFFKVRIGNSVILVRDTSVCSHRLGLLIKSISGL